MSNEKYNEYLLSPEWDGIKQLAYMKHGDKCICGRKAKEIHHLTYDRIFNERLDDLLPLCCNCHSIYHEVADRAKKCVPTPDPELVEELYTEKHRQLVEYNQKYLEAKEKEKTT